MINWENYEDYLALHADGELSPAEEKELEAFMSLHPGVNREMKTWELARLIPDATITFDKKSSLLKPANRSPILFVPKIIRYGIAACLFSLLCFSFFKFITKNQHQGEIVTSPQIHDVKKPYKVFDTQKNITAIKDNQVAAIDSGVSTPLAHTSGNVVSISKKSKLTRHDRAVLNDSRLDEGAYKQEVIKALPIAVYIAVVTETEIGKATLPVLPDPVAYAAETKKARGFKKFWNRVPLDKRNKKQMEGVAGFVANACQDIGNAKQELEDKSINLKIENYQIVLSVN